MSFYEAPRLAALLQQLLADGGSLIEVDDHGVVDEYRVDVGRTAAMLALTAFHDIMKVEALLPAVAAEHAPYLGFKEGDVINDHDLALGYVLDFHADVLPSFAGLTAQRSSGRCASRRARCSSTTAGSSRRGAARRALRQVQGGDAPTASSPRRRLLLCALADRPRGCRPVAARGLQWLVLKFPQPVLGSFISSFSVVNELANKTTLVFETYLEQIQQVAETADLGPAPQGDDAIALMRLVVQAQMSDKQAALVAAFNQLMPEDRRVL